MRTLLVCRHAKSDWDIPGVKDFDRPLNERGLKDAPQMGKLLAKMGGQPGMILTSPAARALATARLLADKLGVDEADIIQDHSLYLAHPETIARAVSTTPDSVASVLVVAHNPGVNQFVNRYSPSPIDNIPTCGVCRIDFDAATWMEFETATHKFAFFISPKN